MNREFYTQKLIVCFTSRSTTASYDDAHKVLNISFIYVRLFEAFLAPFLWIFVKDVWTLETLFWNIMCQIDILGTYWCTVTI